MNLNLDKPSVLIDCQGENVENPLWHPHHQALYWTDIPAGRMFRYYPQTDTYEQIYDGEPVGGFTIQKDGKLLLFKTRACHQLKKKSFFRHFNDLLCRKITDITSAWGNPRQRVLTSVARLLRTFFSLYLVKMARKKHSSLQLMTRPKGTVEIWDEGKINTVISEIPAGNKSRFNDAIADPEGRVYSGIMATETTDGKLYRIDRDGSYHVMAENCLIPNGMGFDAKYKYLYFTDSDRHTIYRFDYDRETGHLSNQQPYIVIPETEGVPDGLTIDAEGYIWSARWNGNHVYRYNPEGAEVGRIELPVRKVSCVTFGGENYDRLFISTARGSKATSDPEDRRSETAAGNIFQLQMKIKGKPELLSQIQI